MINTTNTKSRINNSRVYFILVLILNLSIGLIFFSASAFANVSVDLSWDAGFIPNMQGHRVYYGMVQGGPYNGADLPEGSSPIAVTANTSTSVSGLSEGQVYYFAISAYSAVTETVSSNEVAVSFNSQLTSPSPVISNIASSNITDVSAVITWTTNSVSTTQIEYGATLGYGNRTVFDTALTTNHIQAIQGLVPNTSYYFRVRSRDSNGNLSISGSSTFTTLQAITLPDGTIIKEWGSGTTSNYPGTIKDTFTNLTPDLYDGLPGMNIWSWSGSSPHKVANTIIIKTDLSNIPLSAVILDAKLYLYQTSFTGKNAYSSSVHRIINHNTVISEVTGYNASANDPWSPVIPNIVTLGDIPLGLADIMPAEDTVVLDTINGYKPYSVKAMVQEWVNNPAVNYGLLINGEDGTLTESGRIFATSENLDPSIRPKLIVTYIDTNQESIPPATTAAPMGGLYNTAQTVTLTCDDGSGIGCGNTYYTIDGTIPTILSPIFTAPIMVSTDTVIKFFSEDMNNNTESVKTESYLIDTIPPMPPIFSGATPTNNLMPIWSWNPGGNGNGTFRYKLDDSNLTINAVETFNNVYTPANPLSEGAHILYVQERDAAGNWSVTASFPVIVDITPPVTNPSVGSGLFNTVQNIALTSNEPGVIYYTLNGSIPTANSLIYNGPINIASNATLKFFGVDEAGNTETVNTNIYTIDIIKPTGSITINNGENYTKNSSATLSLSAMDDSGVVASMQFSYDNLNWGVWEPFSTVKTLSLTEGSNDLYVRFKDEAGNVSNSYPAAIVLDTISPVITITLPNPANVYNTSQNPVAISGVSSDNLNIKRVVWQNNSYQGVNGAANGLLSWSANDIPVSDGENIITVTAYDDAGNQASASLTIFYSRPANSFTREFGEGLNSNYPGTVKDTFTNLRPDIYEGLPEMNIWSWSSPSPHKVANTIIIKTDLSSIPSSAVILDARLYLYQTAFHGESTYSSSVHRIINHNPVISEVTGYNAAVNDAWSPVVRGTTYNNIPLGLADIMQAEDTVVLDTVNGYKSYAVKAMVQEWVSTPSLNYGLLVNGEDGKLRESGRIFAASENIDPSIRPKLIVTYSTANQLSSIALTTADPVAVILDSTLQITATASYYNNNTQDISGTVMWTSSDSSVAAISSTGLVTAVGIGSAEITASLNGVSSLPLLITVTNDLLTINIVPVNQKLNINDPPLQLAAEGSYENGLVQDITNNVSWFSSNLAAAIIDSSGVVSPVGLGTTIISAAKGTVTSYKNTLFIYSGWYNDSGNAANEPNLILGTDAVLSGTAPEESYVYGNEVIYSYSSLDPLKSYRVTLTYYDPLQSGNTTYLETENSISIHGDITPDSFIKRYTFNLPPSEYADGIIELHFKPNNVNNKAVISEIMIEEGDVNTTWYDDAGKQENEPHLVLGSDSLTAGILQEESYSSGSEVVFLYSGFDPARSYDMTLTYYDPAQNGYATNLVTDAGTQIHGDITPDGTVNRLTVPLPDADYADGILELHFMPNNQSNTAIISEILILPRDQDGDGIPDYKDNCILISNVNQRDTDGDNYGNICDGDFNNDGVADFQDLGFISQVINGTGTIDPNADMDGNGAVNLLDLGIFKNLFGQVIGPSGLVP